MAASNAATGSGRTPVYASAGMHDRRRRILSAARNMIATGGLEQFSMRELGERANVAQRTLYNIFQSKDHLLAEAVKENYFGFVNHAKYEHEAGTLHGAVERLVLVHRENIRIKNYTRTLMAVYFAPQTDHELWTTIHDISADNHRVWIQRLADKRQLHPWIDVDQAANRLTSVEYATINEWCQNLIRDDAFVDTLTVAVLTFVAGLTRGAAYREIVGALADFASGGRLAD